MASQLMDDLPGHAQTATSPSGRLLAVRGLYLQIGFAVIVALGCFGGGASIMNLAFTPMALAVAIYLALTYVPQYLSFTMWLWMLTPFVRRLIDLPAGYHDQSIVMLAPFLVSCIAVASVPRFLFSEKKIVIIYAGIIYPILGAFVLGLLQGGSIAAIFALLTWIAPVLTAMLIISTPDLIEENAEAVFKAFGYGALVMGGYGIYQFFVFPAWDSYWITNSGMVSLGSSASSVRIFSTMNSPGVFAMTLASGILANLVIKAPVKPVSIVLGLTAFMLSLVRSAWGGFAIALLFIMATASMKQRARYFIAIVFFGVASLPLLTVEPIADKVQSRLESLSDTENDHSYAARVDLFNTYFAESVAKVIGKGLGNSGVASSLAGAEDVSFDNGILDNLMTFGILGFILIPAILCMIALSVMSYRLNPYANASAAVTILMTSQIVFANILYAPVSVMLFVFSAIAITYGVQNRRLRALGHIDAARSEPLTAGGTGGEAL